MPEIRQPTGAGSAARLWPLHLSLIALACASEGISGINGQPGRIIEVPVHGEVQIRLQSIGAGEYVAPPQLSSAAVRFVGASLTGPSVPAGVTQLFSFAGVAPGTAVVTFVHTGSSATVVDTILVQ